MSAQHTPEWSAAVQVAKMAPGTGAVVVDSKTVIAIDDALSKAEQQRDELHQRVEQLLEQCLNFEGEAVKAKQQRDELQAKCDELKVSLEKMEQRLLLYGKHRQHCPARISDSHHACTCGLSAARVDARPVWGASKPATNTIPDHIAKASGRCKRCDGIGDVYGLDGEWRGECTECEAAKARVNV